MRNIYDSKGNVKRSVGGDIYRPVTIYDSEFAELLDGEIEETNLYTFKVDYEFTYGIYLHLFATYEDYIFRGISTGKTWFWGSVSLRFE